MSESFERAIRNADVASFGVFGTLLKRSYKMGVSGLVQVATFATLVWTRH